MPDKVLRPVLATILVIVGVRMLRASSIAKLVLGAEKNISATTPTGLLRVGAFWKPGDPALISLPGSSAAPGSLRKKYAGIVHPPNMVRLPSHSTTSGITGSRY